MVPRRHGALAALTLSLLLGAPVGAGAADPREPVGEPGTPVAGATVGGAAPDARRLDLRVVLEPRDADALERFATAVSTPGSVHEREHLDPGEFAARFGPTAQAIATVRGALRAAGLEPGAPSRSGLVIPVRGTVAEAEAAFATTLVSQTLPGGGVGVLSTETPTLPRAAAAQVAAVVGLTTTAPLVSAAAWVARPGVRAGRGARASGDGGRASRARPRVDPPYDPTPCGAATTHGDLTADVLATAYDFDSVYDQGLDGSGQTVALVELAPYASSDIQAYTSCYGVTPSVTNVDVNGGPSGAPNLEPTLDIEVVAGMAPGAAIHVYQSPNTGQDWLDLMARIADDDSAAVVSSSWGLCEPATDQTTAAAQATILAQMAAQGQTYLNASMDHGSSGCWPQGNAVAVSVPSSQVWATAVGGTELISTAFPPTEVAWGGAPAEWGSGGGISTFFAMPDWQAGAGVIGSYSSGAPCGAGTALCRQVPDVSAQASAQSPYAMYLDGQWGGIYGTSAATPLWASLIALGNGTPGCTDDHAGFLNRFLYQQGPGGLLNDVTVGSNDVTNQPGDPYPATVGYDMATGLGSPRGGALVAALCPTTAPQIVSAASATFAAGQPASFTVRASSRPRARLTIAGVLPGGIAFVDRGDGTGTLSGTPGAATTGTFPVTVTASNGFGVPATQALTVTVVGVPTPASSSPPPTPSAPSAPTSASSGQSERSGGSGDRLTLGRQPRRGWPVTRAGRLALPVACPEVRDGCTVDLAVVGPVRRGRTTRAVTLGRLRGAHLDPGDDQALALALDPGVVRRLRRQGVTRLRARVTLTSRFAGGGRSTTTRDVVLRLPAA
jgi:hypothetical protein